MAACLLCLLIQLIAVSSRTSMSWDEGHHLFDGFTILKHHDYALNPEVPPLAKAVAAAPLLTLSLYEPAQQGRSSQLEAFLDGKDFLFRNDADQLLTRGRLAIALFTMLLAWFTHLLGRSLFGTQTALLALALFVFDPTLLAHGALVTTDAAISCLVLVTVFVWLQYTKRPSVPRLLLTGVVLGLALATKFTGLFLIPSLTLLGAVEAVQGRSVGLFLRRLRAVSVAGLIGYVVLWAAYGFRYAARPQGMAMNPPLGNYLVDYARVADPRPLAFFARLNLLPEAYLWGLANTKLTEDRDVSYFFGQIYRHGTWRYFPAAITIKSTLPLLVLLILALVVFLLRSELRWRFGMLLVPVVVFLAIAMHSQMNIGIRHILPIYPFLYLLGAAALVAAFARRPRALVVAATILVGFQALSSLRSFPAYIAYANEAWGGPQEVSRYLSDSNSDWGQQLKTTNTWLRAHQVSDCWMAYTASGVVDERYYGIPCKSLPTAVNLWWIPEAMDVPGVIEGTILISDDELRGVDLPFGVPSFYSAFRSIQPVAILDGGVFVYQGRFDLSAASTAVKTDRKAGR